MLFSSIFAFFSNSCVICPNPPHHHFSRTFISYAVWGAFFTPLTRTPFRAVQTFLPTGPYQPIRPPHPAHWPIRPPTTLPHPPLPPPGQPPHPLGPTLPTNPIPQGHARPATPSPRTPLGPTRARVPPKKLVGGGRTGLQMCGTGGGARAACSGARAA